MSNSACASDLLNLDVPLSLIANQWLENFERLLTADDCPYKLVTALLMPVPTKGLRKNSPNVRLMLSIAEADEQLYLDVSELMGKTVFPVASMEFSDYVQVVRDTWPTTECLHNDVTPVLSRLHAAVLARRNNSKH